MRNKLTFFRDDSRETLRGFFRTEQASKLKSTIVDVQYLPETTKTVIVRYITNHILHHIYSLVKSQLSWEHVARNFNAGGSTNLKQSWHLIPAVMINRDVQSSYYRNRLTVDKNNLIWMRFPPPSRHGHNNMNPSHFAHARYGFRMIDRFLYWGDHGKIKSSCQPPPPGAIDRDIVRGFKRVEGLGKNRYTLRTIQHTC